MKQTNRAKRAAARYMREVRRNLPCSFRTKYELLSRLQGSLADFTEERPHACYEDITEHFGAPTDVADAYFADLPAPQLRKALQTARFVRLLLTTVIALKLLLYAVVIGMALYNNHRSIIGGCEVSINQGEILKNYT